MSDTHRRADGKATTTTAPKTTAALLQATARALDNVRLLALRDGTCGHCQQQAQALNRAAAWTIAYCLEMARELAQTRADTHGRQRT